MILITSYALRFISKLKVYAGIATKIPHPVATSASLIAGAIVSMPEFPPPSLEKPVYIQADKRLVYDDVMFVLKSLKQAGFTKVALQTNG